MSLSLTSEIFWEGLKAGLVTFGGAFTVIPFLTRRGRRRHGWLTESQFVDGLAIGRRPARSAGHLLDLRRLHRRWHGGALAITLGIFLPAFVLPIFFHRSLVAIAENQRLQPFLLGVAAGVTGLIAAVTVDIVDTSVVDVPTAILAVGAFLVLMRWHGKLSILYVVLGCGAIGAVLQATGVA